MSKATKKSQRRPSLVENIVNDPRHHLAGAFVDQDVPTPPVTPRPNAHRRRPKQNGDYFPTKQGFFKDIINLRWMVVPSSSIKGVILPILLYYQWQYFSPNQTNPFAYLLFVSHRIAGSSAEKPLYQKGYGDLAFLAYYIVVFSFIRQLITIYIFQRFARWWGIKSSGKIARFGEQSYAMFYFGVFGIWGLYIMRELPTWFYRTEYFWIDYPHWAMPGNLKCYYLLQSANWLHQFLVLVLKLEKPRSDFVELSAHHVVTLWLIGWSYLVNLTLIGNAVFISMDLPDSVFALSKLLNYMGSSLKHGTFTVFVVAWSYFRHYQNLVIIKSVWSEFHLVPESSRQWNPPAGAWLAPWMQYQIFIPLVLLQMLNLFWYFLILRIIWRVVTGTSQLDDERSDDEGDDGKEE